MSKMVQKVECSCESSIETYDFRPKNLRNSISTVGLILILQPGAQPLDPREVSTVTQCIECRCDTGGVRFFESALACTLYFHSCVCWCLRNDNSFVAYESACAVSEKSLFLSASICKNIHTCV